MPKSEQKINYKEALQKEVNLIPEQDVTFIIKLITIIRKHIERTREH